MTQDQMKTSIEEYFKEQIKGSDRDIAIATAQALAYIEGLHFWIRERDPMFLPSQPDVVINLKGNLEEDHAKA